MQGVKTNPTLPMTFTQIQISVLLVSISAGGKNAYKVSFDLCRHLGLIGSLETQVVVVSGPEWILLSRDEQLACRQGFR